jgi:hypothetical protein
MSKWIKLVLVLPFMPSTTSKRVIEIKKTPPTPVLSIFLTVLSVLLIVFGALGLIYVQTPLQQESFDSRRDASVANGQVLVSFDPDNQAFTVGREGHIDILVNTQNLNTTGVEFVFNVITETVDELNITNYGDPNLQVLSQEVEQTDDGYLVSYKAVATTGRTFLTTSPKRVISLVFTPQRTGEIKLAFDAEKSTSFKANTTPPEDLLKTVGNETYNVQSGSSSSDKSCNDSCSNNGECPVNHRCFENRCRLVTNVSSSICATPPDRGLQRSCNQYCADTRECASGFTCYFNRCRRPDNVQSTTCVVPSAAVQDAIRQSCNKSCASNADCANNMRCYSSQCRLATNPSSTSCSAATSRSVSGVYYTNPGPTKGEPGPADLVSPRPGSGSGLTRGGTGTQSGSATGSGFLSPRPSPSASVRPSPAVTPLPSTQPGLFSRFGQMGIGNFSLPMIALMVGVGLLVIVIIMTLLNLFRRRSGSASGSPATYQKTQAYENELQNKINALKSQQANAPAAQAPRPAAPAPATPVVVSTPPPAKAESEPEKASLTPPPSTLRPQSPVTASAPVEPVSSAPRPINFPPKSEPAAEPNLPVQSSQDTQVFAGQSSPQSSSSNPASDNRASSMLERIRQKGITPPGPDDQT